ncbi:hypothetical protein M758_3G031800 [Ceratodon purpureus]|nr:hypothetical protein M758_3G031800 [Ceratodon purpureus]
MALGAHAAVGVAIAVTTISVSSSVRGPGHVSCGLAWRNGTGLRTSVGLVRDRSGRWQENQGKSRQAMQARAELNDNQKESLQLYGKIERVIADTAKRTSGGGTDPGRWQDIQGSWVLTPSKKEAVAVVHFIGGVFVGATPQLTYRLFLERLCERGYVIIATPYASGFDHLRIADEAQFKFDRCLRALMDDSRYRPLVEEMPIYGVGHSLGALTHLLIGARYAVQRKGNIILSFNNRSASDAIPFLSPMVAPMTQNIGPLLSQLTSSPAVRLGAEVALKRLKEFGDISPPMFKQVLPFLEQLLPLYQDFANGKDQFTPAPQETDRLIKAYYGVKRNLLIKFKDDTIDETPRLAQILAQKSAVSAFLDLTLRALPGDHARPCLQVFPELPDELTSTINRGTELFSSMAAGTPWVDLAKGFAANPSAQRRRVETIANIESLVDEISTWISASPKDTQALLRGDYTN